MVPHRSAIAHSRVAVNQLSVYILTIWVPVQDQLAVRDGLFKLFGAVVMIGLGCESNQLPRLVTEEGLKAGQRIQTLVMQEVGGTRKTVEAAVAHIRELLPIVNNVKRAKLPANAPAVQDVAINSLVAGVPGETSPVNRYLVYCGPNQYSSLTKFGYGLDRVVDLGWSWIRPFSIALL